MEMTKTKTVEDLTDDMRNANLKLDDLNGFQHRLMERILVLEQSRGATLEGVQARITELHVVLGKRIDEAHNTVAIEKRSLVAHGDSIRDLGDRVRNLESGNTPATSWPEARIRALEVLLQGDEPLRAEWAKQKALGVTPNIPEPPIGVLQAIENTFSVMQTKMGDLHTLLGRAADAVAVRPAFVAKLEAFFGPMLQGKNPPLDGHQIADKEYVDEAVRRVAGAIRSEVADSISFVQTLLQSFTRIAEFGWKIGDTENTKIIRSTQKLVWTWCRELAREAAEQAARNRPGRLQSLVYAVTGKVSNGAHR